MPIWVCGMVASATDSEMEICGQTLRAQIQLNGFHPQLGANVGFLIDPSHIVWSEIDQCFVLGKTLEARTFTQPEAQTQVTFSAETALNWNRFIATVRSSLADMGLIEAQTPSLVMNSGMEPHLEPIMTEWKFGSTVLKLPLATSPELHLKKLLCHGLTDIFEVKTCYRNQELSEIHEPEFQMLEWYRAFADLDQIETDLRVLIERLKPGTKFLRTSFQNLFRELFNFELRPDSNEQEVRALAQGLGLDVSAAEGFDEVFQLIASFAIEPRLDPETATLIYGFPPSQAALARLNADGFAQRFELYWKGLEIANAFDELTNPKTQRLRHMEDQKKRKILGRTPLELDEKFLRSLEKGLPPSGGIALGLDRLFMAVYAIPSIQKTRAFSMRDVINEKG